MRISTITLPRVKIFINVYFAWYDFWIGVYLDRYRTIYVCPLPMCCIAMSFYRRRNDNR